MNIQVSIEGCDDHYPKEIQRTLTKGKPLSDMEWYMKDEFPTFEDIRTIIPDEWLWPLCLLDNNNFGMCRADSRLSDSLLFHNRRMQINQIALPTSLS